ALHPCPPVFCERSSTPEGLVDSQRSLDRRPWHELEVLRARGVVSILRDEQPAREARPEVAGNEIDPVGFLDRSERAARYAKSSDRLEAGQAEHRESVVALTRGNQPAAVRTLGNQREPFKVRDEVSVVDRHHQFPARFLRTEAPQSASLLADVERPVARVGDTAFDLRRNAARAQVLGAELAAAGERQAVFLDRAMLERGERVQGLAVTAQAEAVAFTLPAGCRGEQCQRAIRRVHLPHAQPGVGRVVAVAGDDDDAPVGQLGEVDVVDQARSLAEQRAARAVVDVQPRFLVGADDAARGRVGSVAPDRRVVRRILGSGADRVGLGNGDHLDRGQSDGRGGTRGEQTRQGEDRRGAHQNAYLPTSWNTGPASSASSSYSSKSRPTWSPMVSNLLNTSRFLPLSRFEPTARIVKWLPKRFSMKTSRSAP